MKTKEKRFLGIFKKKTTPAPAAPPPPQESVETNRTTGVESATTEDTTSLAFSSTPPEDVMPPRKGSIAQTSVIHYSPPGTVRASFPPSATSSVVSGGSDDSGTVVITRKSNIVLDDEESVISTPVSQYDESPIVQKPRSKRAAPPPPPPTASIPPMTSSSVAPSLSPATKREHFRQTSTNSIYSTATSSPPPPPPHRKQQENEVDYEEMLKKLQNKFEEWNQVRLEDGGSFKEEKIKAEMLKDHEKLKTLLEKQITSDRPKPVSNNNNIKISNNNTSNGVKKQAPLKIPQYGNFYAPPVSSPSPPARVGAVPGGTVYQKVPKQSQNGTSSQTDENRNEVVVVATKQKVSVGAVQNTEAVDRLRREVEEQRQREKEVKQYRNPKTLEVQVKSPEPKRKELLPPPHPQSPTKSKPRMVEYKPMKSPGLPIDPEDIYEEIEEKAPPIPNTPPPKLSEYRKEQQGTSPRMPTVPSNGYVRLQMNGASKKVAAPSAPVVSPTIQKIAQKPYTGPEFASSPKLLRKNPDPPQSISPAKMYTSVPVKEEKKYEKPQVHPQMTNGNSSPGGMITATSSHSTSSSSSPNRKNPPMTRGASVDQNGYGYSTRITIPQVEQKVAPSPVNYRKMVKEVDANRTNRTVSEDQSNYGYASKTTINIATSPFTQRKSPSPSKLSPMTRAMSTDQTTTKSEALSPSSYRKISAPVTTSSPQPPTLRSLSTENSVPSPSANRRSMPTAGILSATSSKPTTISATSPPYPKTIPTVAPVKVPIAPKLPKQISSQGETFDISDVLKGPKLRKVGMPVERSGISLGKVVDTESSSNRPTSTPPPPPPPPPPVLASPALQPIASKNPDLRDSLMSEIREAGRLRAARAAQSA